MQRLLRVGMFIVVCTVIVAGNSAYAQESGAVGIRLGIGTDLSGGIAYGGQLNYTLFQNRNAVEMGLAVFGGKFEEDSNNGFNDYHEETTIFVVGAIVNYLFRYALDIPSPYFLAGIGVGSISVEWEERSDTDSSLGTPLPGGGSMQSEDATAAGLILNFGIGHRFNETFDLRAQVPTFFISETENRDGKVVPTITITAGLSF